MKKLLITIFVLVLSSYGTEFRFGTGNMGFTGGFLGFSHKVTENITTFSLVELHKNISKYHTFYSYEITWYDSDHFKQMQSYYNSTVNSANEALNQIPFINRANIYIPTMDYTLQGLDAGISLGYDPYFEDENNYFGIGGYLGINLPWIDSKKDSSSSSLPIDVDAATVEKFFKDSKTKIKTYKLGITFKGRKAIAPSFSAYFDSVLAYQVGNVKNDYAKADFDVDGTYTSFDIGIRFQPFEKNYDLSVITLKPRVFVTLGYKYQKWDVKDIAIDISGMGIKFPETTMKFDTNLAYLGVGYSF